MAIGERIQSLAAIGDRVWVWDGEREPEYYGPQLPTFNWLDPAHATTTTTSSVPASAPTTTAAG
jgi:hypothetical protein